MNGLTVETGAPSWIKGGGGCFCGGAGAPGTSTAARIAADTVDSLDRIRSSPLRSTPGSGIAAILDCCALYARRCDLRDQPRGAREIVTHNAHRRSHDVRERRNC